MQSFGPIAPHYDLLMATVPYRMWTEYLKLLLIRHDSNALKLLDVCCGTGTVSDMLANDGYEVTGFDISPGMIEKARAKDSKAPIKPRYEVGDARTFELGEKFEAAFSFFDSLNYIADLEGFRQAIAQVAKHLEPGSLFIFDLNTSYAFEADMFTQSELGKKATLRYNWVGRYDRSTRVIRVEMDFWRGDEHLQEVHIQRAHDHKEVREALDDAGFEFIEVLESYTLEKPRRTSDRIHYVARLRS